MSAHFEIVRTDAEQPWHARLIVAGRITWRVENLSRMVGAERSILSLARTFGYVNPRLTWNVEGVEKVLTAADPTRPWLLVHYIDKRTQVTP